MREQIAAHVEFDAARLVDGGLPGDIHQSAARQRGDQHHDGTSGRQAPQRGGVAAGQRLDAVQKTLHGQRRGRASAVATARRAPGRGHRCPGSAGYGPTAGAGPAFKAGCRGHAECFLRRWPAAVRPVGDQAWGAVHEAGDVAEGGAGAVGRDDAAHAAHLPHRALISVCTPIGVRRSSPSASSTARSRVTPAALSA